MASSSEALACGRRRPHHHGQGRLQLAADSGQVAQQAVGGLAHHPGPQEVLGDAIDEVGVTEQLQGRLLLGRTEGHRRVGRGLGGPHHLLGQALTRQQHPAQLPVHHLLGHPDLARRRLGEGGPGPGRVQVQGVDVEDLAVAGIGARHQHVDPQGLEARHPGQPPHPPAPVAVVQGHLVAGDLGRGLGRRGRGHRGGQQRLGRRPGGERRNGGRRVRGVGVGPVLAITGRWAGPVLPFRRRRLGRRRRRQSSGLAQGGRAWTLAHPRRGADGGAQGVGGRGRGSGHVVGVGAGGEQDPEALDAHGHEPLGQAGGGPVPGRVAVIRR